MLDHTTASAPAPREGDGARDGEGLVVRPFRGLRYVASAVSDLAAVTSPPYDVIDPDDATHLEALDPHNVVRLILPRGVEGAPETSTGRYAHAADLLAQWREEGVLELDECPAFYVYEQSRRGDRVAQRGLLAAVELRDPEARVVLPHEDVMPGPVVDRLELMRATGANLEPILLVYEGGGAAAEVIESVGSRAPLIETVTGDGLAQRVWAVSDPDEQARVATDLAPRQALIADGHHRWATYRRLQAERHAAGAGAGPWDRGLAMLVDSRTYPLEVAAIHRVVPDLSMVEALSALGDTFTVTALDEPADGDPTDVLVASLEGAGGQHPFVLTDGESAHLIADPDPVAVADALPDDHSARWRSLDASVLHALLLDRLWGLDRGAGIEYLHDAGAAVRAARRLRGVAVLMRPVAVADVLALAAAGERMPRKSTSFGPKPRTGLVLRLLES